MSVANSPAAFAPSLHNDEGAPYREPLSVKWRMGLVALVIFFHVGGAWALMQVQPTKLEVGEVASMEVRLVPSEQQTASAAPPELQTPPPEDTPPPEPQPQLESMIQPPLPDLPPPTFPVQAPPPKPPAPKPAPAKPAAQQTATAAPKTVKKGTQTEGPLEKQVIY